LLFLTFCYLMFLLSIIFASCPRCNFGTVVAKFYSRYFFVNKTAKFGSISFPENPFYGRGKFWVPLNPFGPVFFGPMFPQTGFGFSREINFFPIFGVGLIHLRGFKRGGGLKKSPVVWGPGELIPNSF